MFTGMPVQGADVRFQVESSIRLRMPEGGTPLRQSGIVRTDSTGAFVFPVVLGKKSLSSLPYRYEIYQYTAEVTTEAGDTQSAQGSISADMNPYQIGIIGVGETLLKDYPQPMRFAVSNKMGIPVKKEAEKEYIAVHYTLKVYDEPSKFGINHGKISKLQLKQNGKIVANYDRGWDIHPTTKEAEMALCILLTRHN